MKKRAEEKAAKEAEEKAAAAKAAAEAKTTEKAEETPVVKATAVEKLIASEKDKVVTKALHEVFDLAGKEAKNSKGGAIPVSCVENTAFPDMVPETNTTYVHNVDDLKNVMLALELHINPYVWGHKGTGKSELFEQIAARTGRRITHRRYVDC